MDPIPEVQDESKSKDRIHNTSERECAAMRILFRDGYDQQLLKMVIHLSDTDTVRYHIRGECTHQHDIAPCEKGLYSEDYENRNDIADITEE